MSHQTIFEIQANLCRTTSHELRLQLVRLLRDGPMRALSILGSIAEVLHPAEGEFDPSGYENVVDAIVGIITRHPCVRMNSNGH